MHLSPPSHGRAMWGRDALWGCRTVETQPLSGRYTRIPPPLAGLCGDRDNQWVRHNPRAADTPPSPHPWHDRVGIGMTNGGMAQMRRNPRPVDGPEFPQPWKGRVGIGTPRGGMVRVRHNPRVADTLEYPRPWKGCVGLGMPSGDMERVRHNSRAVDTTESPWPWKGRVAIGTPNGGMRYTRYIIYTKIHQIHLNPSKWGIGTACRRVLSPPSDGYT